MGKLERLAAARERVRKWKAAHPKSVEWQKKRWYERKKEGCRVEGVKVVERNKEQEAERPRYQGETHYEDLALVEGEPEVVRANARAVAKRTGRPIPVALMEPKQEGGDGDAKNIGAANERGVGQADTGGPAPVETAEEHRVEAELEKFKAKARTPRGVVVELEL